MAKRISFPARVVEQDLARARRFIESAVWKYAHTMSDIPHSYTLGASNAKEFEHLMACIESYGYQDRWGKRVQEYLVIETKHGLHKYWGFDLPTPLVNRADPIPNAVVQERAREIRSAKRRRAV